MKKHRQYKIGDIVSITDIQEMYPNYVEMFETIGFNNTQLRNDWYKPDEFKDRQYKIFDVRPHPQFGNTDILISIRCINNFMDEHLTGPRGIKLIRKSDVKIKLYKL